jgi:ubiquinone/menaquinone biosynthesis C-methylase UbiE
MEDRSIAKVKSSLICPACSKKLREFDTYIMCTGCKKRFAKIEGIPELMVKDNSRKAAEAAYHSSISTCYRELHQLSSYRNRFYHLRALKPILSLPRSLVLELGCGTGYDAVPLLKRKHLVVETDIAHGQVSEAKKQISKLGLGKHALFYTADAENLPFADETFDTTFIIASLHHLEHPLQALQEMKRCTKSKGYIIAAMEPNRREWIRMLSIPFSIAKFIAFRTAGRKKLQKAVERANAFREPTVERTFTKREIINMACDAGLTIKHVEPVWFLCGFLQWLTTLLNKISTRHWHINRDIDRLCVHFDRIIASIPLISLFCCNWTLVCVKDS